MTFEELEALLTPEEIAASDRLVAEAPPFTQQQLATVTALLSSVESRAA